MFQSKELFSVLVYSNETRGILRAGDVCSCGEGKSDDCVQTLGETTAPKKKTRMALPVLREQLRRELGV